MKEIENYIEVFLTKKIVDKKASDDCFIVDDIANINCIISWLRLNGRKVIYIILDEPISQSDLDRVLNGFCNEIVKRGLVLTAKYSRMGVPADSSGCIYTLFDENNKIKEDRYMITYYNTQNRM